MNLKKIKIIADEKEMTLTHIAEKIDMSIQNLHKCFKNNRIEAGDLEKIANVLEVSVLSFFDESETEKSTKTTKSCQYCKNQKEINQLLKEKIWLLEDKLEGYGYIKKTVA